MQLYFVEKFLQPVVALGADESFHAVKVMRMKSGDEIFLTDGKGNVFKGVIVDAKTNECKVELITNLEGFNRKSYSLHIATALTRNRDRFEWFVEKATEMGISQITPLISERSTRDRIRTDRIEKIIQSAAKQAKDPFFPVLNEAIAFDEFIGQQRPGPKFIAHCNAEKGFNVKKTDVNVVAMIGPEGDFTDDEVNRALNSGFESCSLGQTVLRVETAALFICASMRFVHI